MNKQPRGHWKYVTPDLVVFMLINLVVFTSHSSSLCSGKFSMLPPNLASARVVVVCPASTSDIYLSISFHAGDRCVCTTLAMRCSLAQSAACAFSAVAYSNGSFEICLFLKAVCEPVSCGIVGRVLDWNAFEDGTGPWIMRNLCWNEKPPVSGETA